jgi:ankyrin repeat protein
MNFIPKEIKSTILEYCFIENYYLLSFTDKSWNNIVSNNELFMEWKNYVSCDKNRNISNKCDNNILWNIFRDSCALGLQKMADYFLSRVDHNIAVKDPKNWHKKKIFDYIFFDTISRGNLQIAKWLIYTGKKIGYPINIHWNSDRSFMECCCNGHYECAKYLIKLGYDSEIGHIDIHHNKNSHSNGEEAFYNACTRGHLKIAKWLIKLGYKKEFGMIDIHRNNDYIFQYSVFGKQYEIVKYLIELSLHSDFSPINIHADVEIAFRYLCLDNNLEMIKWLIELGYDERFGLLRDSNTRSANFDGFGMVDIHAANDQGFVRSCGNNIELAKYLIELSNNPVFGKIDIHADNESALITACNKKQHDIVKWLIKLGYNEEYGMININIDNDKPFREACKSGNLKSVKYLWRLGFKPGFNKINIRARNDYAFRHSCRKGRLNIVKWLIKTDPTINIHARDEYAFRKTCSCNKLSTAKWLFDLSKDPKYGLINIHINNEEAFVESVTWRYYEISKWLITIGFIDIHTRNDKVYAYLNSRYRMDDDMLNWLIEVGKSDGYVPFDQVFLDAHPFFAKGIFTS